MKLIKAFLPHVRTSAVIEALADAGYRSIKRPRISGYVYVSPVEQALPIGDPA